MTGDEKDAQHLEKKVKAYNKTGKFNFAGMPASTFASETSLAQQQQLQGFATTKGGAPGLISQLRPSRL